MSVPQNPCPTEVNPAVDSRIRFLSRRLHGFLVARLLLRRIPGPVNEPVAVVSAMAAATKNIGFGVTVSTTYEEPYHLARRLSTVDHLTKGR